MSRLNAGGVPGRELAVHWASQDPDTCRYDVPSSTVVELPTRPTVTAGPGSGRVPRSRRVGIGPTW